MRRKLKLKGYRAERKHMGYTHTFFMNTPELKKGYRKRGEIFFMGGKLL
ncbi:MAG: hypothetical protein ABUT20_26250 [Bacteroidota bacterium]